MQQATNTILMIRPKQIRSNEQTATTNFYQKESIKLSSKTLQQKALKEFDTLVEKLKEVGVKVIVLADSNETDTPDAHFPNNWISFHKDGTVAIYPMFAENRRLERREDILDIIEEHHFNIENIIDYSSAEVEGLFLEGTGSLVLDRVNKKAYCAISPRADEDLLIEFCEDFEYTPIPFVAYQTINNKRVPIYHTNVMMCVANNFAVICSEAIDDKKERKNVIQHLKEDGKEIIYITQKQVEQFAGNMLQVLGSNNKPYLVMSTSAFNSLNKNQLQQIEKHNTIIHSELETIETCGGGSARCMLAEIFLPKQSSLTIN